MAIGVSAVPERPVDRTSKKKRTKPLKDLGASVRFYDDDEEARCLAKDLFARLDINGNGTLDRRELGRARNVLLSADVSQSGGDDLVAAVSSLLMDSDGDNDGEVTFAEWIEFSRSVYEISGRKRFVNVTSSWASTLRPVPPVDKAVIAEADSRRLSRSKSSPVASKSIAANAGQDREEPPMNGEQPSIAKTKTSPVAVPKEENKDRAATVIQSAQRGKKGREKAISKKKAVATAESKKASTAQPLSSCVEVWELLTIIDGRATTTVEVVDIVDMFAGCKGTGLTASMEELIPMYSIMHDKPAEDLSPGEVAHLCAKLSEARGVLSEEAARQELSQITDELRLTNLPGCYVAKDITVTWKQFKQLVYLLSVLMRIDDTYILSHMAWWLGNYFEMCDDFVGVVMEKCAHRRLPRLILPDRTAPADGPEGRQYTESHRDISEEKFNMNAFRVLCTNCDLIDQVRHTSLTYEGAVMFFQRVVPNMPQLLQHRQDRRKRGRQRDEKDEMDSWMRAHSSPPSQKKNSISSTKESGPAARRKSLVHATSLHTQVAAAAQSGPAARRSLLGPKTAEAVEDRPGFEEDPYVIGRTEFSILMEELHKEENISQKYKSPLSMILAFMQKAESTRLAAEVEMAESLRTPERPPDRKSVV